MEILVRKSFEYRVGGSLLGDGCFRDAATATRFATREGGTYKI